MNLLQVIKCGLPRWPSGENLPTNEGVTKDARSVPGLGRSSGVGNGNPLQYSCPENSWAEEPGGLQPWGHKELDTTEPTYRKATDDGGNTAAKGEA